jgi:hypothetical protein
MLADAPTMKRIKKKPKKVTGDTLAERLGLK